MSFDLAESETVFRGRVFNIRQDKIRLPDGRLTNVDVVEHNPAVTIIPLTDAGQVWFIRQYRHPAGKELLELPAGVMDAGEEPAEAAQRELREEIGMAADKLNEIGSFYLAPGYSTEYMHVFLAQDLHPAPLQPDEGEFIRNEFVAIERVPDLVRQGKINDAKSLASLLLWQNSLLF